MSILQLCDVLSVMVSRPLQGTPDPVVFDSVQVFFYANNVTQLTANTSCALYWVSLTVNVPPYSQANVTLHGSVDQLTLAMSYGQLPGMYTMFRAGLVRVTEDSELFVTSAYTAEPASPGHTSVSMLDIVFTDSAESRLMGSSKNCKITS
jgi:hypothetical protein